MRKRNLKKKYGNDEAYQVDIDKNQQEEDANYFDEDDLGERQWW